MKQEAPTSLGGSSSLLYMNFIFSEISHICNRKKKSERKYFNMEYNYLVTYKARKNKEDKEINSTIPIILNCPIYQPEVLMHVNEAIKDLHRYDDIMLMNVEVLNLENEEMKAGCENPFYCTCGEEKEEKEQEKEELHEEDPETKCDDKDLKVYADLDQQLGKVFGEELGHEILKALVQFVCKNPLCLLTMGV